MTGTIHLQLLLATFAGWVGRHQACVIAYLIEENRVLKEQLESTRSCQMRWAVSPCSSFSRIASR